MVGCEKGGNKHLRDMIVFWGCNWDPKYSLIMFSARSFNAGGFIKKTSMIIHIQNHLPTRTTKRTEWWPPVHGWCGGRRGAKFGQTHPPTSPPPPPHRLVGIQNIHRKCSLGDHLKSKNRNAVTLLIFRIESCEPQAHKKTAEPGVRRGGRAGRRRKWIHWGTPQCQPGWWRRRSMSLRSPRCWLRGMTN